MRALLRALCVALIALASSCQTLATTQVLVHVRGEGVVLEHAARLHVEIRRQEGDTIEGLGDVALAPPLASDLLVTVPVVPADADASRHFFFTATLFDADGGVLAEIAEERVGFVADQLTEITFVMRSACEDLADGAVCGDCLRCAAELCRTAPNETPCHEDGGPSRCEGDVCRAGECVVGVRVSRVLASGGALGRDALSDATCALSAQEDFPRTVRSYVYCWGANELGQLGRTESEPQPLPAITLRARTFVRSLAGGRQTTCILLGSEGSRACWGENTGAELGSGSTTPNVVTPPQELVAPPNLRSLSGGNHFCGVDVDGRLFCWGVNGRGQIGEPPGGVVRSPREVVIASGDRWRTGGVDTGGNHTCAIRTDGEPGSGALWCWGYANNGQLGDGSTGLDALAVPQRTGCAAEGTSCPECPCFDDWTQVANGEFHTCGLRADGTLWCWGGARGGQLGLGNAALVDAVPRPQQVAPGEPGVVWNTVRAGVRNTCATRSVGSVTELYCWGDGDAGQLGNGTLTTTQSTPALVDPPDPRREWLDVSLAADHVCGILDDESLWCWGSNDSGQLGIGTVSSEPVTRPVRVCLPPPPAD
ncbi:MAG: hypothetical protein M3Y87_17645 [Myxococcota bacterium]|nr:hypothetical protein [Myxococcota bacterium]